MARPYIFTLVSIALLMVSACGGLSKREKAMVGAYYIPAISDTQPLMVLGADGTSTLRAIRPGELTYSVRGKWEMEGDSLIIVNDPATITIESGDATLVGHVSGRIVYPVVGSSEATLSISRDGITYDYHRRGE